MSFKLTTTSGITIGAKRNFAINQTAVNTSIPPAAATGVFALGAINANQINWTPSIGPGTVTQNVMRSNISGSGYVDISGDLDNSINFFNDTSSTNDIVQYYIIRSTNAFGSTDSAETSATSFGADG